MYSLYNTMGSIYYVIVLVCSIAMLAMCFHVHSNPTLDRQSRRYFALLFIGVIIAAQAEATGTALHYHQALPQLHRVAKLVEFCVTPYLGVCMALACGVHRRALPVFVLLTVHALLQLGTAPLGLFFYIDASGIYHRGPWYDGYIAAYALSFAYLIYSFVQLSQRFRQRDVMTRLLSVCTMLGGVIPSVLDSATKTAFLGVTMTSILLYVYYEGLTEQDMAQSIAQQHARLRTMQSQTIVGLATLIESRDQSTGAHIKNTANYVQILAEGVLQAGLYPEQLDAHFVDLVVRAAPMHDIGKISVPDAILQKPGRLTEEEFAIMRSHAAIGGQLIQQVLSDITDEEYTHIATEVAAYHHEKWDGSGYPYGLRGEQIPLAARIMAIADVYDALTMERVYKKALPVSVALDAIASGAGTHFDPLLAPLFVRLMRERTDVPAP